MADWVVNDEFVEAAMAVDGVGLSVPEDISPSSATTTPIPPLPLPCILQRATQLPGRFAGNVLRHPTEVVKWPFKALRKLFGLLREVNQVAAFEQSRRRSPTPGRLIR